MTTTLRLGWASRDITPTRPAVIPGQMHARIGREAADPLTLTALAVEGAGGRFILVSCDVTGLPREVQAAAEAGVRAALPELAGAPVVLNATHTHESFLLKDGAYPPAGPGLMTADEGREWLVANAVAAAVEAWNGRRERSIGRAFAEAVVGHNRRAVYADGRAVMYGRTAEPAFRHIEGGEDHGLDLLAVREPDGTLAGLVLDIPCPSQVDEHLTRFSADFWHEIRVELRRRLGGNLFLLPLCGAAGDLSPHPLLHGRLQEEMRRRRGVSERQDIALRVAEAVERALPAAVPMAAPPVGCRSLAPALPRRAITREERDWAVQRRTEALARGDAPELWYPSRLQEVVDRFERGEAMPELRPQLHVLRLGEVAIATNPFELYLDYGNQIRARSRAGQTLLVQLAGGSEGYLASARSIAGGHYGSHPSSSPTGAEGGQALVEATLAAIAELFPEGA